MASSYAYRLFAEWIESSIHHELQCMKVSILCVEGAISHQCSELTVQTLWWLRGSRICAAPSTHTHTHYSRIYRLLLLPSVRSSFSIFLSRSVSLIYSLLFIVLSSALALISRRSSFHFVPFLAFKICRHFCFISPLTDYQFGRRSEEGGRERGE